MLQFAVWITYKYSDSSLKITVQEKWWPKLPCLCSIALPTAMSLSDRVEGFPFLFNGIIFFPAQSAAQPEPTVVKIKEIQKANHKPEWATCKSRWKQSVLTFCLHRLASTCRHPCSERQVSDAHNCSHSCSDVSNPRAAFGLPHPGILRVTNAFSEAMLHNTLSLLYHILCLCSSMTVSLLLNFAMTSQVMTYNSSNLKALLDSSVSVPLKQSDIRDFSFVSERTAFMQWRDAFISLFCLINHY